MKISIKTGILGSEIVAALKSQEHRGLTRVWCKDNSLHLVTGYENKDDGKGWFFDSVVGYWEIPEGASYLSPECREVITRPFYLNA